MKNKPICIVPERVPALFTNEEGVQTLKKYTQPVNRNEHMVVFSQGVSGKGGQSRKQGRVRITTTKGYNEPANTIEVDVLAGTRGSYKKREEALLSIEFKDGTSFNGTFAELAAIIVKGRATKDATETN